MRKRHSLYYFLYENFARLVHTCWCGFTQVTMGQCSIIPEGKVVWVCIVSNLTIRQGVWDYIFYACAKHSSLQWVDSSDVIEPHCLQLHKSWPGPQLLWFYLFLRDLKKGWTCGSWNQVSKLFLLDKVVLWVRSRNWRERRVLDGMA